jgi:hypothetical protein
MVVGVPERKNSDIFSLGYFGGSGLGNLEFSRKTAISILPGPHFRPRPRGPSGENPLIFSRKPIKWRQTCSVKHIANFAVLPDAE